ncbi:estradiol 17-beta-dehydrogenase 8 [Ixodes scapularis]|uniref:estradiol 17-beta-dehydrogenase 8 n=1 Tax=Ixodes scapularis TaxID=6945 RepID=UPI001A9F9577|nr:estradiol 17-beta-dehydrogenase 8 [Ixodes scapularis]
MARVDEAQQAKALDGRLALVTGGGGGIGASICAALAEKGARVLVADIDLDAAQRAAGVLPGDRKHGALQVDIGNSASVKGMFEHIKKMSSVPVSIVVNCAGTVAGFASIIDTTEENFDKVVRVNLKGTFLVTQEAVKAMLSGGVQQGSVVNISSLTARIGMKGLCGYVASKAGVVGFTKTVALDLAGTGIRCNAVLPGYTDTPAANRMTQQQKDDVLATIPLGRPGRPREIADVVVFLCCPESSYMTGAVIEVAGGIA